VVEPSSDNLHPREGARFVFERVPAPAGAGELRYEVRVYLPAGELMRGQVAWTSDGAIDFHGLSFSQRVAQEVVKLARVLKKDHAARLIRWRPLDDDPA
jgi:hypothetical protein